MTFDIFAPIKRVFDCFDFCMWTLGQDFSFEEFEAPQGDVYTPDIEDLVTLTEESNQ